MTIRVVNTLPLTDDARARLAGVSPDVEIIHHQGDEPRWTRDGLEDGEVEVLFSSHPPADLRRTPRLRWVQLGVAGIEHIDPVAIGDAGIIVTNASGIHAVPIGEHVVWALLHAAKRVEDRLESQRRHEWLADPRSVGRLLRGQTVVIVGYGSVGREVGRLTRQLGMRIIAVKASPTRHRDASFRIPGTGDPSARFPERMLGPADLVDAVREADHVVVTLPATSATQGIIGDSVLRAMRSDAWLVNVGRGACVDTRALVEALLERWIGGAILDVFEEEPLPASSPLWDLPNCIVTPHVSGGPPGAFGLLGDLLVGNLTRYVAGRRLLNLVDVRRGY